MGEITHASVGTQLTQTEFESASLHPITPAGIYFPVKKYKAADETINNSDTLQNDDDLYFAIAANEKWYFECYLIIGTGTTSDFKFTFTVPSGATISVGVLKLTPSVCASDKIIASGTAVDVSGNSQTNHTYAFCSGVVINGSTAGNVQLQWAQNTAEVSDTILKAGSHLHANIIS